MEIPYKNITVWFYRRGDSRENKLKITWCVRLKNKEKELGSLVFLGSDGHLHLDKQNQIGGEKAVKNNNVWAISDLLKEKQGYAFVGISNEIHGRS